MLGFWVSLDEQRAAALAFESLHDFPCLIRMTDRVRADQRNGLIAKVAGCPHRTELRMHKVGTPTWVRLNAGLNQGNKLIFLRVDDRYFVAGIRGNKEIPSRRIKSTVMQKALSFDVGHFEVLQVGVVDHQDVTGFLNVDHKLRVIVRRDDCGNTWFRMILLCVVCHATR